ncbi:MAG: acetyl-CoA carboxylase biotin carboxyl carrier protein [Acidimicrobiales bacterium]
MTPGGFPGELDVERLLAWLAASDVTHFELRIGGAELVYRRHTGRPGDGAGAGPGDGHRPRPQAPVAPSQVVEAAPAGSGRDAAAPAPAPAHPADVLLTAPMAGIFHHAPAPGAPPYVVPRARVTATATVGLMESMKVFTALAAGTAGTVVAVVAGNGQPVVKGELLVTIRPDRPAGVVGPGGAG